MCEPGKPCPGVNDAGSEPLSDRMRDRTLGVVDATLLYAEGMFPVGQALRLFEELGGTDVPEFTEARYRYKQIAYLVAVGGAKLSERMKAEVKSDVELEARAQEEHAGFGIEPMTAAEVAELMDHPERA